MEIGKISLAESQFRFGCYNKESLGQSASVNKLGFTGIKTDSLKKDMIELLPGKKSLKFLLGKCKEFVGEKASILITAIGTGFVAPLSIAFNPFVKAPKDATPEKKEDIKNNKIYSAWRQPISAILAVIFQLGALKPIDIFLDERFNNPKFSSGKNVDVDMQAVNKKSYIERQQRKAMKAENRTYASNKEFQKELEKRIKNFEKKQLDAVAEDIAKTGQIHIGERTLGNDVVAKLFNEQLSAYIEDALTFKIPPNSNPKSKVGHCLEFYKQRATTLVENEELLKDVLSKEKLPADPYDFKIYIMDLRNDAKNPDLKKLFQEILDTSEPLRESRCQRTLERIAKIKKVCGNNFTPEKYMNKMIEDNYEINKYVASIENCMIDNPAEASAESIKAAMKKFAASCGYEGNSTLERLFRNTEEFSAKPETVAKKLQNDIARAYKKLTENKYKSVNQISKIIVGVFITLPITCTALNWIYPRFMDLFFPNLSKSKKSAAEKVQGGNK